MVGPLLGDILSISVVTKSDNLQRRQSLSLPLQSAGRTATAVGVARAPYFHMRPDKQVQISCQCNGARKRKMRKA